MPLIRHLQKPPITEAIFDIRVITSPSFRVERFTELEPQISRQFPKRDERRADLFRFKVGSSGANPPELTDSSIQGYFFKSEDEKLIAQFRIDGFTLNRLKPYTSWEHLFPVVMELWDHYRTLASPVAISRIALRYINHIPLIAGGIGFANYLTTPPQIPEGLPQLVESFFSRISIKESEAANSAHISLTLEPDAASQPGKLLFDIDAFKITNKLAPDDHPTIFATFQDLRDFKNKIFFNYLTEEILEHFE